MISLTQQQLKAKELHLVHRLDKETSGVLLLTPDPRKIEALQQAMKEKIYVCVGRKKWDKLQTEGAWTWPLTDKAEGRQNPQGAAGLRKACESQFTVLDSNSYMTAFRVRILSGRTHQIRKHAALADHALVGDPRYNDKKYNEMIAEKYQTFRLFLHAAELSIEWSGESLRISAPLPVEFKQLGLGALSNDGSNP